MKHVAPVETRGKAERQPRLSAAVPNFARATEMGVLTAPGLALSPAAPDLAPADILAVVAIAPAAILSLQPHG